MSSLRAASLQFRVPALAVAILAASLLVMAFIAYQRVLLTARGDLDALLLSEHRRFEATLRSELGERFGDDVADVPLAAVREEVDAYFDRNPADDAFLAVVEVGSSAYVSVGGPEDLRDLQRVGQLPPGTPGRLDTVRTDAGEVRVLVARIAVGERVVGSFRAFGWLEPAAAQAALALRGLAAAGLISLWLGGVVLALALRSTVAPLTALATAARSIELADLSTRVAEPDTSDEVAVLAREFNAMLSRLERAAAERKEFLATVSHELRTPITVARGHIEVLETTGGDADAVAATAAVVREELGRMSRLVDDLLTLARADAEGFVAARPFALPELFDDLRLRLAGLGLDRVDVHPPPAVAVVGDRERIAQALLNLVTNADVHTPPGTSVRVRAEPVDGGVAFHVADDGPGFDPAIRPRAFEPFVTAGGRGSAGLGLAVVAAVAAAHGGYARIADGGEDGNRVTVWVPAEGPAGQSPLR